MCLVSFRLNCMMDLKIGASVAGASHGVLGGVPDGVLSGVIIYFALYVIQLLKNRIAKLKKERRDDE